MPNTNYSTTFTVPKPPLIKMAIFTSKFVQTLRTFSEAELKSFDKWLHSPWCNSNKNLPKLLEKLKKYYPDFAEEKLTKEKLFRQVLPKGKYSDRRFPLWWGLGGG
ncbi:MAG: hypothetical protein AAGJ18_00145 [Bacteroidota bacterium]